MPYNSIEALRIEKPQAKVLTIALLKISEEKLTRKFSMATIAKEPSTLVARTFRDFIRVYRFFIPF